MKNSILISAQLLKDHAVGPTPTDRFKNLMRPEVLGSAASMLGDDGEKFQACLAALVLSYQKGTPEHMQVTEEIQVIAAVGRALNAQSPTMFESAVLIPRTTPPLGLMALWHGKR